MKRLIIFIMISLLLAGGAASSSMALTYEEIRIYNDLRDTCMGDIMDRDPTSAGDHFDEVFEKVARKHGITVDEVNRIWLTSNMDYEFTNQDIAISEDFWGAFNVLPRGATGIDRVNLLNKVANQYGVTVEKVKDIAFRTM